MAHAAVLREPELHLPAAQFDLQHVEGGVSIETMISFAADAGLPLQSLYDVVIPARTLKHRRSRQENLSRDESDKLARVVRIFELSEKVFGDREKALRWLSKPKARFSERAPLNLLSTEVGGRMVEEALGQIDEGYFA